MESISLMHLFFLGGISVVVCLVITKQWAIRNELSALFQELLGFMPSNPEDYKYINSHNYEKLEANREVTQQLQSYINANQHVAPNFDIVKDIVERTSTELDDRVRTLLSIPLYYGLCGTILGIILGLIPLIIDSTDLMGNISILLSGVAIAMLGSLVGIFITSTAHSRYKEVSREHEAGKRTFFNWFQVTQLPVIGSNPSGPIGQLIRSLSRFNEDFASSADTMTATASEITKTFEAQKELLSLMREFANPSLAQQNIAMAQQMERHVDIVRSFNNSILGMQGYVEKLQTTTADLQSSTEYLQVVRDLVTILNSEREAISKATGSLAHHIGEMYSHQQELVKGSLNSIQTQNTIVVNEFKEHLDRSAIELREHLRNHHTLPETMSELTKLPSILEGIKEGLKQMSEASQNQHNQFEQMTNSLLGGLGGIQEGIKMLNSNLNNRSNLNYQSRRDTTRRGSIPTPKPPKGIWTRLKELFNLSSKEHNPLTTRDQEYGQEE